MIWFTSDLHFGHSNVLEYEPKRKKILGTTIEQHDQALIDRINSKVKSTDTLYLLGDLGMYRHTVQCVKKLNGNKILIRGNHDRESALQLQAAGILVVAQEMLIRLGKNKVRLSHFPYRESFIKTAWRHVTGNKLRHYDQRPINDGKWLLHGHVHGRGTTIPYHNQIHIGVDTHSYLPWSADEIITIINKER